jgi:ubiquinone/menaquinone biosynthesis C-methylase UbiE
MNSNTIIENDAIAYFWETHPCGSEFVHSDEARAFFINYDKYKYSIEPHILDELAAIDFRNKKVLEIGLGQGAEAQRIIEAGAKYYGIDLTAESIRRVSARFDLFSLQYDSLQVMNAENIEFDNDYFDIVFSHGVIHHSPRIKDIILEIHRVLKPGGIFCIMLYHRNSINFHISIRIIRRAGILLLYIPWLRKMISKLTKENTGRLQKHLDNLNTHGLSYLRINNFLHKSTDGPDNVYSSVFSKSEALGLFSNFNNVTFSVRHLNERHLPLLRSVLSEKQKQKLAERFGWHLWIKGTK